jgi:hypothetical protein
MRTYLVTQVIDWNGKPLGHLVQMTVEARSPSHALSKIAREYKMPKHMFRAELRKEGK